MESRLTDVMRLLKAQEAKLFLCSVHVTHNKIKNQFKRFLIEVHFLRIAKRLSRTREHVAMRLFEDATITRLLSQKQTKIKQSKKMLSA